MNDGPNTQGRKNTLQITALNTRHNQLYPIFTIESEAVENVLSTIKNPLD